MSARANSAILTFGVSAISSIATAIIAVVITFILTRRREHESDWRKLKLAQYEEYIRAHSGVIEGRATPEAHRRYADAVNSLALVAPPRDCLKSQ